MVMYCYNNYILILSRVLCTRVARRHSEGYIQIVIRNKYRLPEYLYASVAHRSRPFGRLDIHQIFQRRDVGVRPSHYCRSIYRPFLYGEIHSRGYEGS